MGKNLTSKAKWPILLSAVLIITFPLASFAEAPITITSEKNFVKTYISSDGTVYKEDKDGNLYQLGKDGRVRHAEKNGDSIIVEGKVVTNLLTEYTPKSDRPSSSQTSNESIPNPPAKTTDENNQVQDISETTSDSGINTDISSKPAINIGDMVKTFKSQDGKVFKLDSNGNLFYLRSDGRVLNARLDGDKVIVDGQIIADKLEEYTAKPEEKNTNKNAVEPPAKQDDVNFRKGQKLKNAALYTAEEKAKLEKLSKEISEASSDIKIIPVENILVGNKGIKFDTPPVIKSGTTLMPIRAIAEALDAEVSWDSISQEIHITKDGKEITLSLKNNSVTIDGNEQKLEVPAQIINGRTVVPLRIISEGLGAKVKWNPDDSSIEINDDIEQQN